MFCQSLTNIESEITHRLSDFLFVNFLLAPRAVNREDRAHRSDRGVHRGDRGARSQAPPHRGRHPRIRGRHQQPRLVWVRSDDGVVFMEPIERVCMHRIILGKTKMAEGICGPVVLPQLQHHYQLHRRPVRALPARRERAEPQAHRGQQSPLLFLLHLPAGPRVGADLHPWVVLTHNS